jgi:hypothetical protein
MNPPQISKAVDNRFFNYPLMRRGMLFWFLEVGLSFVNYFVLINLVYQPRWGELAAHQIGMTTRIIYIFLLAFLMVRGAKEYHNRDPFFLGLFWIASWLAIEWGGSLAMGRPVSDIVIGWNILDGHMWTYVLLSYLTSALIIGSFLPHGKR